MIQQTDPRRTPRLSPVASTSAFQQQQRSPDTSATTNDNATGNANDSNSSNTECLDIWGHWSGRKHYSLEVVQHPIRARMCGFGDKDRRPLAPAAVAKMVVRNRDDSLVDVDDIDWSFFLVTVDLWSADGKQDMNLVLHPSSADRFASAPASRNRRRGASTSTGQHQHQQQQQQQEFAQPIQASVQSTPTPTYRPDLNPITPAPPSYSSIQQQTEQQQQQQQQQNYLISTPIPPPDNPYASIHTPTHQVDSVQPTWPYSTPMSASIMSAAVDRNATYPPPGFPSAWSPVAENAYHQARAQMCTDSKAELTNQIQLPMQTYDGGVVYASNPYPSAPTPMPVQLPQTIHIPQGHPQPQYQQQQQQQQQHYYSTNSAPAPPFVSTPTQFPPPPPPISASTSTSTSASASTSTSTSFSITTANTDANTSSLSTSALQTANPTVGSATSSAFTSSHYPNQIQTYPAASIPPMPSYPRMTYTRTLVGPLSANACRLQDEHRKPGIFFLFQDLSVRTEGTFRLRMRLMNVGAPPAPEYGANRVHNDVSPVLAQTFTEPFTVFSAKRFPGVPDTTALSIAFGSQGQKLPLRNRNGTAKRRRRDDSSGEEDSDEAEE